MNRSKLLANGLSQSETDVAHAVILTDAVILTVAVSGSTMDRIAERLGDRLIECSLSEDGFLFAAILSPENWEDSLDDVASEVDGLSFTDNQNHDCNRLDDFVGMMSWIAHAKRAIAGW